MKIDARQRHGVDRDFLDGDGPGGGIVDGLADEFGVGARAQFEIADIRGDEIVGRRDLHDAGFGGDRGVHGDGVEAVVERDVTGERVVDALLRFNRYDRAPAGHGDGPFDGVGADIGAAVDGDDALAMRLPPPLDQVEGELDVDGVGGGGFQQQLTDAAPAAGTRFAHATAPCAGIRLVHAIVETIGDHRAVMVAASTKASLRPTGPRERITCHRVIPPAPVYRLCGRGVQIAPTGTGPRHRAFSSL